MAIIVIISLFGILVLVQRIPASLRQPIHTPHHQDCSEKNGKEKLDCEHPKSTWEWATDDPVAAFTLALVAFTAILAGVSVVQIRFLVRADENARVAANLAAEAAARAKKDTITTNRAFVSIKEIRINPLTHNGFERPVAWRFDPVWENSGQTATKRAFNYISWELLPGIPPENTIFNDFGDAKIGLAPVLLGPRAIGIGQTHNILTLYLNRAKNGNGTLFIRYSVATATKLRLTETRASVHVEEGAM